MPAPDIWRLTNCANGGIVEVRFRTGEYVLGSSPDCDLRIADPTVSRRHARLHADEDGVTIEDLGSTNGTSVNGEKIRSEERIGDRTEIKFGRLAVRLERIVEGQLGIEDDSAISSGESVLLGSATVGFLRDAGTEVAFTAGEVVIRRGEKHDSFYVVIEGEVELVLDEGEGHGRPIARVGEGGIFGAESALGRGGAAIGAVATTDVVLLRYPAAALPTALQESASLRQKMLGGFARHLHKTTSDALDLLHGTEVIARLVQGDHDPDAMIAVSPRMKSVKRKVEVLAETSDPALLVGEDGTGKTLSARLIHDRSDRSSGPLIAVNCRDLRPGQAAELILGENLGGRLPTGRQGCGGLHLAHGGTLVLRGADSLEPSVQQMVAAHIQAALERPPGSYPNTRFVVTARSSALTPALEACFEEPIELPPLAKRPKDIMPLAEAFLAKITDQPIEITQEARHALLANRYQRRNVAELREVLELAVRLAEGPEIGAEHIFGGVGDESTPPGLPITDTPLIRRLLTPFGVPALQAVTFAGFAAAIVLCLAFATSAAGRIANTAIWSLWEPTVFALFFIAGPVWCTICPLSTGARFAKRSGWPGQAPPPWMLRHGPWLAIVGFALIIWVERVFGSTENPIPSGLLLLSLIVAAVVFGLLFKREAWCRHLCPLGRLATALAPASVLQIKAKPSVCASTCTTHQCYKGTDRIPGCTVFHHPLEGKQAHRCKLCTDCLRSCPHNSTQLQIRAPLMAVWRLDASSRDLAMFAMAVSLLAIGLVAAHRFEVFTQPLQFTLLCLLCLAAGIALHHLIMALAGTDRRVAIMVRLAMTLMILGWATLMVSQLANIVVLNEARITLSPSHWLPTWVPLHVSLVLVLQVGIVLTGFVLALISFTHIQFEGTSVATRIGRVLTPLIFVAYAATVIGLLIL
jgi:transcriptional regulator with AAA-type ATPase domain/polyferredoxin